jgi:hypothetical protein
VPTYVLTRVTVGTASPIARGAAIAADPARHARPKKGCEWLRASGARGGSGAAAPSLTAIQAGAAYANVHTTVSPGGEIRGQIRTIAK